MYTEITPNKVQETVHRGFQRMANFRNARLMFIRNYVGQYYDRVTGEIGAEALNMIFNAVRVLLPTIVMDFPKHTVVTPYLQIKQYADLLGLALSQHDMKIDITNTYRRVIVDALFTLGVTKTGLAASPSVYAIDDEDDIDAGTVYTEAVDFDNFVVDPDSKEFMFKDARFMGDRITIPRRMLLESGLYKNDLVESLPRAGDERGYERAYSQSMKNINPEDNYDLEDDVEICEIWVPSANALITVPGSKDVKFDDYLRVADYYGVKEGPYSLLALTPPVPGNPLPVPMLSVWNDLHILGNRMVKKIVEQAERQKDVVTYKSSSADDAEEIKNAADGDMVRTDDPEAVKVVSLGGQQNSNEVHLAQLQGWFNQMAANPDQLGGSSVQAGSATAANILQSNASLGLEDIKDLVYKFAASEARKRAFYFHTDPLIQVPLTQRQQQPAQYAQGPAGPQMIQPPTMQQVQVVLTPEMRSGDFMDFVFNIEPESMGRRDSKTRYAQALDFAAKIIPSAAAAAQTMALLGIPFSAQAFIMRMAKDAGIDWMDEVFYDPNFQLQMAQQFAAGPQNPGKGEAAPTNIMPQILQNGQPSAVNGPQLGPPQQQSQDAQQGANQAQRFLGREASHAAFANNPIPFAG